MNNQPFIAMFGGPAGAGKSTLARRWADIHTPCVHIEHDAIGNLICSGKADFQAGTPLVAQQVKAVSKACCALASSYLQSGFNVALDHVFYPGEFENDWAPYLLECRYAIVIIRPDLPTTLVRGTSRGKFVREDIVRDQYIQAGKWPAALILDTTDMTIDESLKKASSILTMTTRLCTRGPLQTT